jgi:hypothetical protein
MTDAQANDAALVSFCQIWRAYLFGIKFDGSHGESPSWAEVKEAADKMLNALAEIERR